MPSSCAPLHPAVYSETTAQQIVSSRPKGFTLRSSSVQHWSWRMCPYNREDVTASSCLAQFVLPAAQRRTFILGCSKYANCKHRNRPRDNVSCKIVCMSHIHGQCYQWHHLCHHVVILTITVRPVEAPYLRVQIRSA